MTSIRIISTLQADYEALSIGGQAVCVNWFALRALLTQRLSPAHAALFAEPMPSPGQAATDWYAMDSGAPLLPLVELPEDEQRQLRDRLGRTLKDIAELADTLRRDRSESAQYQAKLLDEAKRYPDDRCVYSQAGWPVLVAWGHKVAGEQAKAVDLTGMRREPPLAMEILPPPYLAVAASRQSIWPFLISLALLMLGALILVCCDPGRPPAAVSMAACHVNPDDALLLSSLKNAAVKGAALQETLAGVTARAGARRLQCQAPPNDEARVHAQHGRHGKLEIILAWDDSNDLDLAIICPGGRDHINFRARTACGGELDIDANAAPGPYTNSPVEHVTFADPASGQYQVLIQGYELGGKPYRAGPESKFRLTILHEGEAERTIDGTMTQQPGFWKPVTTVSVGGR